MFDRSVVQISMLPPQYLSVSEHICAGPEVSAGEGRGIVEAQTLRRL